MKLLPGKLAASLTGFLLFNFAWAEDMPSADPEAVGLSSERLARYSAAMEKGIEAGHFPGAVAAVARNGKIAFFESYGLSDKEAGQPMTDDAIFRIASMTKAVTGVAVMILYEEGHFKLNDPVSRFIPSFKDARVLAHNGSDGKKAAGKKDESDMESWPEHELKEWLSEHWYSLSEEEQEKWLAVYNEKANAPKDEADTVPVNRPMTIRDLLRHTAGISYNPGEIWEPGDDLERLIDNLAAKPLKSQPGTRFEYGLSMDVLARLVEVVSGQTFDVFIQERIFDPLAMKDTGFWVPKERAERLVKMKEENSGGKGSKKGDTVATYLQPPVILMGGTGLVSTTMDYLRFCQMLLNNGELDGERILGRKAVELMRANHMNDVTEKLSSKGTAGDFRFGLTFGVKGKPGDTGALGSEGSYYWGGAYGTSFWIDPSENLVGVFMVNGLSDPDEKNYKMPYSQMLEHFTYQAIID
ncbi:MAG: serine hydrolase domain-containing protein [Gammaproteobacteria bacterium]